MNLNDPVATALRAADAIERAGHRYALTGGLLMAAYGEPRETHDADVAVLDLTAEQARVALEAAGVRCTIPKFPAGGLRLGGLLVERVTLLGGDEDLGVNVLDLIRPRSARYAAAALDRATRVPLRDRTIVALSPEDFVVFKALATRDRDVEDAASVLRRSSAILDLSLIEREVEALAAEITDWDVRIRWAAIREQAAGK